MNLFSFKRLAGIPGLLVGFLALTGCSSFRTEMGRPVLAKAPEFFEGQTGVATVLSELGAPQALSSLSNGYAFLYEYSRVREFQFGISVNFSVLRYFKFLHAWNDLDQEVMVFTFDDRGVLQSQGDRRWKEDLGGGNALQFIVAVASLSDISELRRPADAHGWSKELLQSPPVTLNTGQSLRNGQHGLEQRLAPDFVGQHTLEMIKRKTEKEKRQIEENYQKQ